jgi:uncharacterized membrane protein YphA (DoxX/SURF4 family)
MNAIQVFIAFLGRLCISLIFISAGVGKVIHWPMAQQDLTSALSNMQMVTVGVPWMQDVAAMALPFTAMLVAGAACIEILGGLLILLGIQVRFGAFLLLLFLIPTTILFHDFWYLQGPERDLQMVMFMKNLSIFGALLILLAFGKGTGSQKCHEKPPEKS